MFKKIWPIALVMWFCIPRFTLAQTQINFSATSNTDCRIIRQWDTGLTLANTISGISVQDTGSDKGAFVSLAIPGYVKASGELGTPQFPACNMLIEIPQNATVSVQLSDVKEEPVKLNDVAPGRMIVPCQPPRAKIQSSKDQPFHFSETTYQNNAFIEPEKVTVEILGTLRSTRLARVSLCPFRYNPVTNQLMVTTSMTVNLSFDSADLAYTQQIKKKYGNPVFTANKGIIKNSISSNQTKDAIIYDTMTYPLTYVVVASDAYLQNATLRDFIAWKSLMGYRVIEANTDNIFTDPSTANDKRNKLKRYLKDLYDEGDTPPAYVLFVGDVDQIPPYTITNVVIDGELYADHVTDLYYCEYTNDYLPEAYYGRMPVTDDAELTAVMTKTLKYEKYDATLNATDYLDSCMLIAGADEELGPVHGNGQVAYLINEYFNTDSGFSEIYAYLYNQTWDWNGMVTTTTTGSSLVTADIVGKIESGVGFVNYNGHCAAEGWANGPLAVLELSATDVANLDPSPYGFYVANCCESSRFELDRSGCIGKEMFLAENKGAVAYLGASNLSFWDEDFFWAVGFNPYVYTYDSRYVTLDESIILGISYDDNETHGNFDDLWHDTDNNSGYETPEYWYTTASQMIYSGNLSVMAKTAYPEAKKYYWEIYNVLGDPSLMPYLSSPSYIADPADPPAIIPCVDDTATVTTNPYAMVALSWRETADDDFQLLGTAQADGNGDAQLSFTPIENQRFMHMVVSGQNLQPKEFDFTSNAFPANLDPDASFYIGQNPTATQVEVFYGRALSITNTSKNCPKSYVWEFGGNPTVSSNTAANPTVTYNELGIFNVTLTVTNIIDEIDIEPKTNYIHVTPYVNFTASDTTVDTETTVTFTDQSQPSNIATGWSWSFPGGTPSSSTEQNPQVIYHSAGLYTVTLRITSGGVDYPLSGPSTKAGYINVDYVPPDYKPVETDSGGGGGCFIGSSYGRDGISSR